jgi:hypothetical protein
MDIPEIRTNDQRAAAVEVAVRATLVANYVKLVEATTVAVDELIYVATHGKHEESRVMAAREILDRADLTPDVHVVIEQAGSSQRDTRLADLHEQLASMQEGLLGPSIIETTAEDTA